jgi:hypothetical protein
VSTTDKWGRNAEETIEISSSQYSGCDSRTSLTPPSTGRSSTCRPRRS